jgi:uncharacterized lipoprotein YmbA
MKLTHPLILTAFAVVSFSLAGCSFLKPKADQTQFYVLRAQSAGTGAAPASAAAPPEIRVGPGQIAGYLQNSSIAIEKGPNRVEYLDLYRWAEPVSKGVSRVLAENLAQKFDPLHVTVHPNLPLGDSGYAIRYIVERLEGTLAGPVTLNVSWQVVRRSDKTVIAVKRSSYVVPGKSKEVSAYVERLSSAIAQWSDDVAAAIPEP